MRIGGVNCRFSAAILSAIPLLLTLAMGTTAQEAQVHAILASDSTDKYVGAYCSLSSQNLWRALTGSLADVNRAELEVLPALADGGGGPSPVALSRQMILDSLAGVQAKPNDTILFYYVGHGAIDPARGHYFTLSNGDILLRSEVEQILREKNVRLAILMTDTCSTFKSIPPMVGFPVFDNITTSPVARSLFLNSKGMLDVSGSSPGQVGVCDEDNPERGTIFTANFCEVLDEAMDESLSWQETLGRIAPRLTQDFNRLHEESGQLRRVYNPKLGTVWITQANQTQWVYSWPQK